MAVPIRTAVAALCTGLAAALLTTAPARAEKQEHTWAVSASAPTHPAHGSPWTTAPARSACP
ncbi:hypothetical protein SPURM210S_07563 [Streptomyces purpurascens]